MSLQLNHTIVAARDGEAAATWFADLFGLAPPTRFGPFWQIDTDNGVGMDFASAGDEKIAGQHYAFLVTEEEFDAVHDRIVQAGLAYWADPFHRRQGAVNRADGGRGLYWLDPNGHSLEVLTVPYGGWPS